jgi:hypothetical protein
MKTGADYTIGQRVYVKDFGLGTIAAYDERRFLSVWVQFDSRDEWFSVVVFNLQATDSRPVLSVDEFKQVLGDES